MAGKKLTFDTGVVEYDVNGMAKVRFNPSDANFIDKFYKTVAALDKGQESMDSEVGDAGDDPEKMFVLLSAKDKAMRSTIDDLLGEGVADAMFPDINCYAFADGLPVWMNLMFAIAEEINNNIDEEQKRTDPRVSSINKKYSSMLSKYKKGKRK